MAGRIRVGVGGWTFAPWRGRFYPAGLAQKRELEYAGAALTSIEINGTFYGSQKPESFRKWRDETPDGFVFSVKGPRFTTNRRVLAEAGESIERFFSSGVMELGDKLGPVNWQLAGTKKFVPEDLAAFLDLLPAEVAGQPIAHVIEARHPSFAVPEYLDLLRARGVAQVVAGDSQHPLIPDVTAPFVYARIMGTREDEPNGYLDAELDRWAARARAWAEGKAPEGLPAVGGASGGPSTGADGVARDVFLYVIGGAKAGNPAAAMRLIERLR